jgi:hypothetical protein
VFQRISVEEVQVAIGHAKNNTAPGPDRIPITACKEFKEDFDEYLTDIFNEYLEKCEINEKWGESLSAMLPKKEAAKSLENGDFRLVMMEKCILKLLTSILAQRVLDLQACHLILYAMRVHGIPKYIEDFMKSLYGMSKTTFKVDMKGTPYLHGLD